MLLLFYTVTLPKTSGLYHSSTNSALLLTNLPAWVPASIIALWIASSGYRRGSMVAAMNYAGVANFSGSLLLRFSTPKIKKKLKHAHFSCSCCRYSNNGVVNFGGPKPSKKKVDCCTGGKTSPFWATISPGPDLQKKAHKRSNSYS